MQIKFPKNKISDPTQFMRRAGYGMIFDRRKGQQSFVRRFDRDLYPRYHAYVESNAEFWFINLHLDQRAPVYRGVTAHAGEYDGELVEREAERLKSLEK